MTTEALTIEGLGRPIRGPQAVSGDWRRFAHLVLNIAVTQWRLRFFGSALGYLWQLVRPLMLFGVLYVFFTKIARVGQGAGAGPGQPDHFYGVQLLGAIVLFTFFAESTAGAVRSVLDNEALVRKIDFPRLVIPLATVLGAVFNLMLNMIVVLIFALASGVRPMLSWLQVPVIVLVLGMLCTGLAMLLSSAYVYFRDVAPIWEVVSQVIFYASPVIVPLTTVQAHLSGPLLHLYMLNPIAVVMQQFKHAFVNHAAPPAVYYLGGYGRMLIPLGFVVLILVLGFVVFNRSAPRVAEDL